MTYRDEHSADLSYGGFHESDDQRPLPLELTPEESEECRERFLQSIRLGRVKGRVTVESWGWNISFGK